MKLFPDRTPAPRLGRFATQVLHDEPNARIITFHLSDGQQVPAHSSSSTVVLQVLQGSGVFRGEGCEARLQAGQGAVYAPGEVHSMEAGNGPLGFLAILTPAPV
jgi:quercetin dioxygenase-like cupin family protein